ncbi:hypothetical protein CDIK_1460 [Cucumispora dikerogammari]|nr:hypothetical protein CDIK_1460 [Cucumispora dikerogammari]
MGKQLTEKENNHFMNTKEKNYISFMNEKTILRQKCLFDYSKIFLSEPEYLKKMDDKQKLKLEKQKKYKEKMEKLALEENLDLEILMLNTGKTTPSTLKVKPITKSKKISRVGCDYFHVDESSKLFIDLLIEEIFEACLSTNDLVFLEDFSSSVLIRVFSHQKAILLLKKYRNIRYFLMKNSHLFSENPLMNFINENFEIFNFSENEVQSSEFQNNFDFTDLGVQIACSIIFNDFSISNLFVNFDESILFENKHSEERTWAFLNLLFKFSSEKGCIIKNLRNTIMTCSGERKVFLSKFLKDAGLKKK